MGGLLLVQTGAWGGQEIVKQFPYEYAATLIQLPHTLGVEDTLD